PPPQRERRPPVAAAAGARSEARWLRDTGGGVGPSSRAASPPSLLTESARNDGIESTSPAIVAPSSAGRAGGSCAGFSARSATGDLVMLFAAGSVGSGSGFGVTARATPLGLRAGTALVVCFPVGRASGVGFTTGGRGTALAFTASRGAGAAFPVRTGLARGIVDAGSGRRIAGVAGATRLLVGVACGLVRDSPLRATLAEGFCFTTAAGAGDPLADSARAAVPSSLIGARHLRQCSVATLPATRCSHRRSGILNLAPHALHWMANDIESPRQATGWHASRVFHERSLGHRVYVGNQVPADERKAQRPSS